MVFLFQSYAKPPQNKPSEINAMLPKSITLYLDNFLPIGPGDKDGMPGVRSRIDPSNQVLKDIMSYCKPKDTDNDGKVVLKPTEQVELRKKVIDGLNERNNSKVPSDFSVSDGVETFEFKNWSQYYDKVVATFLKEEATHKVLDGTKKF